MSVELICEWGIPRDLPTALAQAEATRKIGADYAKWQLVHPDKLASERAGRYWDQALGGGDSQRDNFTKAGGLEDHEWRVLGDTCRHLGVGFACSPFDLDAVDVLCDAGVDALKIASGDLTYRALVEKVAQTGRRVFCSVGAASRSEIVAARRWLGRADVVFMACDLVYPCPPEQADLATQIPQLAALTEPRRAVGYSDHTRETTTGAVAVTLGATVLEKHCTLNADGDSPDDRFALTPDRAREYLSGARDAFTLIGRVDGDPQGDARVGARRSAHAARTLPAGYTIATADVVYLRPAPAGSLPPTRKLAGRKLTRTLNEGEMITLDAVA